MEAGLGGVVESLWGLAQNIAPLVGAVAGGVGLGSLFGGMFGAGGSGGADVEGAGLTFPWQTPPGEGFIAPWSEAYQGPTGKWWGEARGVGPVMIGPGEWILKFWHNGSPGRSPTVLFWKTNKRVFYRNAQTGAWGTFIPKKPVVISRDPRISQFNKIERVYDRITRKIAKKSKALKLAKGR
jgi:hypothetical protein